MKAQLHHSGESKHCNSPCKLFSKTAPATLCFAICLHVTAIVRSCTEKNADKEPRHADVPSPHRRRFTRRAMTVVNAGTEAHVHAMGEGMSACVALVAGAALALVAVTSVTAALSFAAARVRPSVCVYGACAQPSGALYSRHVSGNYFDSPVDSGPPSPPHLSDCSEEEESEDDDDIELSHRMRTVRNRLAMLQTEMSM